jgi:hypothetical protein
LLMTPVGLAPLLAARFLPATRAAVTLTMITTGAEIKPHRTLRHGRTLAESNRRAGIRRPRQACHPRLWTADATHARIISPRLRGLPLLRSTDQQKTLVALTTGVSFPADPTRPAPFSEPQRSRPVRSDSDDRSDDTDYLYRHSFRFRRSGMIDDTPKAMLPTLAGTIL